MTKVTHTSDALLELHIALLSLEASIDALLFLRAAKTDHRLSRAVDEAYVDLIEASVRLAHTIDSRADLRPAHWNEEIKTKQGEDA